MAAMKEAMRPYADDLGAEGMLALASQLVGNLAAMQDQRRYSAAQVMTMIERNIQIGNDTAIESLLGNPQGSG